MNQGAILRVPIFIGILRIFYFLGGPLITFIIGGARSGKSRVALEKASLHSGKKAYIATAQALDEEMKARIKKHKKQRGDDWDAFEEPVKIAKTIKKIKGGYKVVVLDCLTLWLSNLMHAGLAITDEINNLVDVLGNVGSALAVAQNKITNKRAGASPAPTIYIVSNEVGMGIVPENEMARRFRDAAGILNQKVAEIADEVYMVVMGIPIKIKSRIK